MPQGTVTAQFYAEASRLAVGAAAILHSQVVGPGSGAEFQADHRVRIVFCRAGRAVILDEARRSAFIDRDIDARLGNALRVARVVYNQHPDGFRAVEIPVDPELDTVAQQGGV